MAHQFLDGSQGRMNAYAPDNLPIRIDNMLAITACVIAIDELLVDLF
jgi:hypothetical protein